ncbi:MAG: hypothetical protein HOP19_06545, partial [Acidobacteria bacterium]|nr:hypothetical protein [Acidobacteriota bacterium]
MMKMMAHPQLDRTHLMLWMRFVAFSALALLIFWFAWRWWRCTRPPAALTHSSTLAGAGAHLDAQGLTDPFGIALADDDLFVTDGRGGRIYRVTLTGETSVIADNLDMPSALAIAPDDSLIVANTGDHTIIRINPDNGEKTLLAGALNRSGKGANEFNAPVGIAVNDDGLIFIADTYNDRICTLDAKGQVRVLAGGAQTNWQDGKANEAAFHTPSGLAVASDGALYVADTGNHRIRRVAMDGTVTTIAGTGEAEVRDGSLQEAMFDEPTALALRRDGALFVADAGGSAIRLIEFGETPRVTTLSGGYPFGLRDGALNEARLHRPVGLVCNEDDALFVVDSGNGFIRALLPANESLGKAAEAKTVATSPLQIRQRIEKSGARWPFHPPEVRREIAGTFGEIRGVSSSNDNAWFHNGLDIPGAYGETVYAMHSERITRLLAVEGAGDTRERLRLPLFGYIHVRIGRDQNDQPLPSLPSAQFLRDAENNVTAVRVPRGTHIRAGQAVGTLNRLNHVHLIA